MTPADHLRQRADVLASELHSHHPDVYARHPLARIVPQGEPSTGAMAQSIRELGEMLQVADRLPDHRESLAEMDRLAGLVGQRLATLRGLIDAGYADAMGGAA